jgi:hypothetical protein
MKARRWKQMSNKFLVSKADSIIEEINALKSQLADSHKNNSLRFVGLKGRWKTKTSFEDIRQAEIKFKGSS